VFSTPEQAEGMTAFLKKRSQTSRKRTKQKLKTKKVV